jgi:hypothetical protein
MKTLTLEHRMKIAKTVKLWWELNKKSNPEFIKQRNLKISYALTGKPRPDVADQMRGWTPPNKGLQTGEYKKCLQCGKDFYVMPCYVGKKKFCSFECFRTYISNPEGWHNVHFSVGNWSKSSLIKEIGKCEMCGCNDVSILLVHHKDGNHKNNKKENLQLLCPNCHFKIHMNNGKVSFRNSSKSFK